jgi:hypothetical protein
MHVAYLSQFLILGTKKMGILYLFFFCTFSQQPNQGKMLNSVFTTWVQSITWKVNIF